MFAFIISVICFVLTVPLKVVIVFLKASNIALVAKDKQDVKNGKVDEKSDSDESQLKGKLAVGKKAKKVINAKIRVLISMNEIAIRLLKFLVHLLQLIALIMQVIGIFGLMIMFIVVIALLAAVAGCVTLVMSDGWQSASGGGSVTGGGSSQQSTTETYGSNATWVQAMETVANWYVANFDTYQSYINPEKACDLPNVGTCRDDCSGYVSAIGKYMGWGWSTQGSSWFTNPNNETLLQHFNYVDLSGGTANWTPRAGDILAYNGHVEMLVSYDESTGACVHWGWGSVKDKYPGGTFASKDAMWRYHYNGKDHPFSCVWQYKGD